MKSLYYLFIIISTKTIGQVNKKANLLYQKGDYENCSKMILNELKSEKLSQSENFEYYILLTEIGRSTLNYNDALSYNLKAKQFVKTDKQKVIFYNQRSSIFYELSKTTLDSSQVYLQKSLYLNDTENSYKYDIRKIKDNDIETKYKEIYKAKYEEDINEFKRKKSLFKGFNRPKIFYIFVSLLLISTVFLILFRRLNKKLTISNKQLNKSVELNKKIFSILSHDLKQPIISLEAMFFLMEQEQLSEDEKFENCTIIKNHLKTTSLFLDDIMTWSKLEIAKSNQLKQNIKPKEIIDSIAELYRDEIIEKSLTLEYNFSDNFEIIGHKILNFIILKNLINNAIKFGYSDSKITIEYQFVDKYHQFSVENQGPPIPLGLQDKLFDENKKLQYLIRNDSKLGFGLGLSIISGLIRDNNGRIWLSTNSETETVKINFYTC